MKQHRKLLAVLTLLCFAMTFLPVAAFAADDFNYQLCSVFTDDENVSVKIKKDVTVKLDLDNQTADKALYVWFVKSGTSAPALGVTETSALATDSEPDNGVFEFAANKVSENKDYDFQFANTGTYTVHAAFANPADLKDDSTTWAEAIKNVEEQLGTLDNHSKIEVVSKGDSSEYSLVLVDNAGLAGWTIEKGDSLANGASASIGTVGYASSAVNSYLNTNGVASDDITFKLLDENGKAVKGATVKLSTSNSHCIVNKEEVVTDQVGQFDFTIAVTQESGHTDGFSIYLECGSYEAELKVLASSSSAHDLEFAKMPTAAIATDDVTAGSDLGDYLWVKISDVNGNTVMPYSLIPGGNFAEPAFAGATISASGAYSTVTYADSKWGKSAADYVSIVSKPAASDLENEDVWLVPVGSDAAFQSTLYFTEDLEAGDYTFKISLANGKYKTVNLSIAEMGTPVKLEIQPKAQVIELGSVSTASFQLVDANGVTSKALLKGTDVAVDGYGVLKTNVNANAAKNNVEIYTKSDDKYAGSAIKIIATNDRYNLSAETTLYINDGSAFLMIPTTEAKVNTPTDITYVLYTAKGMMNISTGIPAAYVPMYEQFDMDPTGAYEVIGGQTSFTVLEKPEGATVNFGARAAGGAASSLASDCYAVARIECDTPGDVTVKISTGVEILQADGTWAPHYYEGTQTIHFGNASSGKNVILSIGSNEIIVNGEKATVDAAPMISNNRTFVPFRALAEAFGATVAYDAATNAITAELNGTTVVMTIGSTTYTVNGVEKTADVAPFINDSRTMVPVRFVAEAFGIKVTPTYDSNGATADILFNL